MTVEAFARKINVPAPYLTELEYGLKEPSWEFLHNLSKNCDINLRYLLQGEGFLSYQEEISQFLPDSIPSEHQSFFVKFLSLFNRSSLYRHAMQSASASLLINNHDLIRTEIKMVESGERIMDIS